MINPTFAERFIRRVRTQTDYNINIMNEHGIIIASCTPERVGSFHQAAYQMIKNNISVDVTEDITADLPGVTSPGVNLLLRENRAAVGVIGVSGNPETVMPLAKIIKLSFESLYDYEVLRSFASTDTTAPMNELSRLLFTDKPTNLTRVHELTERMRIVEQVNRYPVLIEYIGWENINQILNDFVEQYPTVSCHAQEDLIFRLGGNFLLLFKKADQHTVSSYRKELCECIEEIDSWFRNKSADCHNHYFCGTVQNCFQYYSAIYDDILWLYRYPQKKSAKIYFLTDYLTEFMMSQVAEKTLAPLLEIHARIIREQMSESVFLETAGALIESNMNLNDAAELLFFHKNTISARIKKIRELLGINPLTNVRDAFFLTTLYNYMALHR